MSLVYPPKQAEAMRQAKMKRSPRRGMSKDEFQIRYDAQGGRCPIGNHKMDPVGSGNGLNSPCFDHSHKTGLMRGIVCGGHNRGLGLFRDSPEELRAAADYLERQPQTRRRSKLRGYYNPLTNSLDKLPGPC